MRFQENLSSQCHVPWSSHYIDYKRLKQLICRVVRARPCYPSVSCSITNSSVSSMSTNMSTNTSDESNVQGNGSCAFDRGSEVGMDRLTPPCVSSVPCLLNGTCLSSVSSLSNGTNVSNGSSIPYVPSTQSSLRAYAQLYDLFWCVLKAEVDKVNVFYLNVEDGAKRGMEALDMEEVMRTLENGGEWALKIGEYFRELVKEKEGKKNKELPLVKETTGSIEPDTVLAFEVIRTKLNRFHSLCLELDLLRKFVVLNYVAVIKILKKLDKNTGQSTKDTFISQELVNEPFYNSTLLSELITKTELYTTQLLMKSTDKVDVLLENNFNCAICLQILRNPVVLSCVHRFCWSCLAQAASFGTCCPVCRKVQDLQPSNYRIDGLLQRFINFHFTPEEEHKQDCDSDEDSEQANRSKNQCNVLALAIPHFVTAIPISVMQNLQNVRDDFEVTPMQVLNSPHRFANINGDTRLQVSEASSFHETVAESLLNFSDFFNNADERLVNSLSQSRYEYTNAGTSQSFSENPEFKNALSTTSPLLYGQSDNFNLHASNLFPPLDGDAAVSPEILENHKGTNLSHDMAEEKDRDLTEHSIYLARLLLQNQALSKRAPLKKRPIESVFVKQCSDFNQCENGGVLAHGDDEKTAKRFCLESYSENGVRASCHQCKCKKSPTELAYCCTPVNRLQGTRACHKKFCQACLDRSTAEKVPEIAQRSRFVLLITFCFTQLDLSCLP